jgi:anaerobic dimethyl sulfoxide reductase subunit B
MSQIQLGFVLDQSKCIGCAACQTNCKSVWDLPKGIKYREVTATANTGTAAAQRPYLSMACNHCENPVCASVCPVAAYTKRDDGVVVQDTQKCIGCKRCLAACPYGAPQWNEAISKVQKCNFCSNRLDLNGTPACVEGCPTKALTYGDMAEVDFLKRGLSSVPNPLGTNPSFRIASGAKHVGVASDAAAIQGDMLGRFKS